MPTYHFETVSDSGFEISGVLEADDEALARRKAQRFCATRELVVVSEFGADPQPGSREAGTAARSRLTWMGRVRGAAAALAGAWLKRRVSAGGGEGSERRTGGGS